ncbi:MATE family efflux transporter [Tichowtungia aerotolerans]|uniref:Multidrug-efflux transporter n=1 Tax=Tichowtungia aerotolerans TaxID=2697043 RepID=A0A6P1LZQ1_9BACT|nr:MATE family efflux transporter [Tichowtungia aerotolerans]QHI68019.1 MATE family efflux transporter [Tichowtungia aerotolerans]
MSKLLTGGVKGHLVKLTLPSIGGMLAIMVFNLTDTWFVSRLGTDQLAAMGFTFAVVMIVGALAIGFSTGAASIISRALGAGNRNLAARTVSDGLFLTIAGTVIIGVSGYLAIDPLFSLLGAEGRVLTLVHEYMQIWFCGAVAAVLPPVCDGCLRAAGDMVRPLIVMCTCAVMNIILDPILIFGWGPVPAMGMRGAALATVFARVCGMAASLGFLHYKHRLISWSRPRIREMLQSWREIVRLGIPAALTQVLNPVAQGFYIRLAAGVGGVQAVAAMATGTRIEAFLMILAISYGIALVPFVGHNFGAGAHERVDEARRASNRFALIYSAAIFLILLPTAGIFSGWFSKDPTVVRLSTTYLLIAVLGHSGLHLSIWMGQLMNVIGRPGPVMVIGFARVFGFVMPLCLIGSHLFGFVGLVSGIALGNLLSGGLAWSLARRVLKN